MATELWLLLSCEWTEAVEEGGESYQLALLLKCSYYYSQSLSLYSLLFFFFSLSSPQPLSAWCISLSFFLFFCSIKAVSWKTTRGIRGGRGEVSKHVFLKLSIVQNLTHHHRESHWFSQLQPDSIPDGVLFVDILFLSHPFALSLVASPCFNHRPKIN